MTTQGGPARDDPRKAQLEALSARERMAVIGARTEIIITLVGPLANSPSVRGLAMIDTGASHSTVDLATARSAKFTHTELCQVFALHSGQAPVYRVVLELPELGIKRTQKIIGHPAEHEGIVALIGRDILVDCTLVYDGKRGQFTLTT
jgi:hypothetical protein